jgi:hypothetical protein
MAAAPRRLHVDEGWPLQSHEDYLATTAENDLSPFCAAAMEGRPLQVAPACEHCLYCPEELQTV